MDDEGQEKDVSLTEALEAKASEARAKAQAEAEAAALDFEARLKQVEEAAGRSRRGLERAHANEAKQVKETQEASKGLGVGLTIAYAIIGTPIAGFLVGYLIDRRANGPWASGLALLGAFGGVAYAVVAANRQAAK